MLGIVCALLALWCIAIYRHARADRKADAQKLEQAARSLSAEQSLRVSDAQRFTDVALSLQNEVISSVTAIERATNENAKLCGLVEKLLGQVEQLLIQTRGRLPPGRR